MGKLIQMVTTSEDNSIFITDFDIETNELSFRASIAPERIQKEIITVKDNTAYTALYNMHVGYIDKFIKESREDE